MERKCACRIEWLNRSAPARRPVIVKCPLCAAAPGLLAALEDICDGACWSLSGTRAHIADVPANKIERGRAALSKAPPGR